MQELRSHKYESKNKDEVLNIALKDLNASSSEVYYDVKEEVSGGILKKKKYVIDVVLKEEITEYVKSYLKQITELMGVTAQFEIQKRDNHIRVNIVSDNNSILIGKNGRTMIALQELLKQSIQNKINSNINILLDTNDYREKKLKHIERLAVKLAKDVKRTNMEVKMDCMNSYERRIVHNKLSDFDGVTTISEGEEPNRYVIIKPVEK